MQLIFDDYRLTDRLLTVDQVQAIVDEARGATDDEPEDHRIPGSVYKPKYSSHRSLYQVTQDTFHENIRQPKVYRQETSSGMLSSRYAVVVPALKTCKQSWQTYIIDYDRPRASFVNLGSTNGAIIENHVELRTTNRRWTYTPLAEIKKSFTIRVNNGSGKLCWDFQTPVPVFSREWINPEGTVAINLRLIAYREQVVGDEIERSYDRALVDIWHGSDISEIIRGKRQWKSLEAWERECPGLVLDMTREDFPLSEQDTIFAIMK